MTFENNYIFIFTPVNMGMKINLFNEVKNKI